MLAVAGDEGPTAEGAVKLLEDLPDATLQRLRGFECHPWSDVIADRGPELGRALLDFLDQHRDNRGITGTPSLGTRSGD
jgi:hypothetical protein